MKSYYETGLQTDIQQIVKGKFNIIPLRNSTLYVGLLDAEVFKRAQEDVEKEGFNKFYELKGRNIPPT